MAFSRRHALAQYAARTTDDALLRQSSSGGVFTELAKVVLADGGVVFGAGWDVKAARVVHKCVETVDALAELRGSKYAMSDMSPVYESLKRHLAARQPVLFTGTPCQTAAIRKNFGDAEGLFCCAVMCHSNVPFPVWKKYVEELQAKVGSRLESVAFRDKRNGWRNGTMRFRFGDGRLDVVEPLCENAYMRLFFSGWATNGACLACPFRQGANGADVMIGDFWGVEDACPAWDDGKGASAVLVYTQKGAAFFERAVLARQKVSYGQIVAKNPHVDVSPTPDLVKRARFQRVWRNRSLSASMRYAEYGSRPREFWVRGICLLRRLGVKVLRRCGLK